MQTADLPPVPAYRKAFKSLLYKHRPWLHPDVRAAFRYCADAAESEVVCSYTELAASQAAYCAIQTYRKGAGQTDLELVPLGAEYDPKN